MYGARRAPNTDAPIQGNAPRTYGNYRAPCSSAFGFLSSRPSCARATCRRSRGSPNRSRSIVESAYVEADNPFDRLQDGGRQIDQPFHDGHGGARTVAKSKGCGGLYGEITQPHWGATPQNISTGGAIYARRSSPLSVGFIEGYAALSCSRILRICSANLGAFPVATSHTIS